MPDDAIPHPGPPDGQPLAGSRGAKRVNITDAQFAASAEQAGRQKRYAITMAFRTACFLSMIWVDGTLRWVLFAGAVLLPYIAVVLANQANTRTKKRVVDPGAPTGAPAITVGEPDPEVVPGHVVAGSADVVEESNSDERVA